MLLLMSCNTNSLKENTKIVNLNVEEFKAKMTTPNVVVVDVRTAEETADGKIEGAIEIDVKAADFEEKIKALDKNKIYLVYCRSGKRSTKACRIMEEEGVQNLYNLKGGYKAWKKQ